MGNRAGIWRVYNGQIMDMRQDGKTLEEVGHKLGVSRQRIHQLLQKHYGASGFRGMICEKELSLILKLSLDTVKALRVRGILQPKVVGGRLLYPTQDIRRIRRLVKSLRTCKNCGGLKVTGALFCSRCWQTNRWKLMSPEARQKHISDIYRWRAENPERWKAIQQRAGERYSKKTRRLKLVEAGISNIVLPG